MKKLWVFEWNDKWNSYADGKGWAEPIQIEEIKWIQFENGASEAPRKPRKGSWMNAMKSTPARWLRNWARWMNKENLFDLWMNGANGPLAARRSNQLSFFSLPQRQKVVFDEGEKGVVAEQLILQSSINQAAAPSLFLYFIKRRRDWIAWLMGLNEWIL